MFTGVQLGVAIYVSILLNCTILSEKNLIESTIVV